MWEMIGGWLRRRRQEREEAQESRACVKRVVDHFRNSRGIEPIGGHVLRRDSRETIVRVMHSAKIPPDRAWYAVSADAIRELTFEDVRAYESPWR